MGLDATITQPEYDPYSAVDAIEDEDEDEQAPGVASSHEMGLTNNHPSQTMQVFGQQPPGADALANRKDCSDLRDIERLN